MQCQCVMLENSIIKSTVHNGSIQKNNEMDVLNQNRQQEIKKSDYPAYLEIAHDAHCM